MMRLVRDVPLDVDPDELHQGEFDPDAVLELFRFLEFPSLVPRLAEAFPEHFGDGGAAQLPEVQVLEAEVAVAATATDAAAALTTLAGHDSVAIATTWAAEPGRSELTGLALVTDRELAEVVWVPAELLEQVADELAEVLCGTFKIRVGPAR